MNHISRARRFPATFLVFVMLASVMPLVFGVAPAYAASCPTFASNNSDGSKYFVSIRGADGSCVGPSSYDGSGASPGRAHVALSSGTAQNPYTITLASCTGADCPPPTVWVGGWGPGTVCSGPCAMPFSFSLNAHVESGVSGCDDTAPLKVATDTTNGAPLVIIEGGNECVPHLFPPPPSVPEFPLGMAALLALAIPTLFLLRKRAISV